MVNYFSESNLDKQKQDFLVLDSILDERNVSLWGEIIIKNVWGRKTIWSDSRKIILVFENNGRKESIMIDK